MGLVRLPASNFGNVPGGLGRTLARLLPMGGSYSFSFSPPVAIPNAWLLCLGQGDLSMIPSGLQEGAG